MGIYDTIYMTCGMCFQKIEEQFKTGMDSLGYWNIIEAPTDLLVAISPYTFHCRNCGMKYTIETRTEVYINQTKVR